MLRRYRGNSFPAGTVHTARGCSPWIGHANARRLQNSLISPSGSGMAPKPVRRAQIPQRDNRRAAQPARQGQKAASSKGSEG